MGPRGARRLQQVLLVPTDGEAVDPVPRQAVVLVAPGPEAAARAAGLGHPVVVCPELEAEPGGTTPGRNRRLEALVRGHAVADRWHDVVVVADADTVRAVGAALCDLPEPPAAWGERDVVTVGLPRRPRPVPVVPVLVAAAVVGLASLLVQGRWHPLLLPALVAGPGLLLVPWERSRRWGLALLGVAVLAAALVLVVVAGSTRFPVQ